MIGALRGTVMSSALDGDVLLDVNGVGYLVHVPTRTALGGTVFLHTHLHVREDAMVLYGFETRDECHLFKLLIGTTGVGPKLALTMLSTFTAEQLRVAVASEDVDALTEVPGIGKRTAQRLMIEMRSRLGEPDVLLLPGATGGSASVALGEARAALEGLGYRPEEIREALASVDPTRASDVLIKEALRNLGAR
ncbi:MAG: Holliday junction branch migration protein RuvA [Acidimicrobiia bacterium]